MFRIILDHPSLPKVFIVFDWMCMLTHHTIYCCITFVIVFVGGFFLCYVICLFINLKLINVLLCGDCCLLLPFSFRFLHKICVRVKFFFIVFLSCSKLILQYDMSIANFETYSGFWAKSSAWCLKGYHVLVIIESNCRNDGVWAEIFFTNQQKLITRW